VTLGRNGVVRCGLGACLAFGLAPSEGLAAPGDHIQVGVAEIVPSLGVGAEVISNAYLSERRPVVAGTFLLQPGLRLDVDGQKARFQLDGRYELRKFFDDEVAQDLDQFSNFRLNTSLELFPNAVVGFTLRDRAGATNRANDQAFKDNALVTQIRNDLQAALPIRVGDVTVEPGFDWAYQVFRIPGRTTQVDFNDRHAYGPTLDLSWRFFPNTAFVVSSQYEYNAWSTNWVPTNNPLLPDDGSGTVRGLGEYLAKPDSHVVKAVTGLRGRITRTFLLDVEAGYGFGDYLDTSVADESQADPGIGDEADPAVAGFGTDVSPTDAILVFVRPRFDLGWTDERTFGQQVAVSYRKDFQDSFFTNYVHQHVLQATLESRFGKHVRTRLNGGVRFETYVGETARNDIFPVFDGTLTILPIRALPIDLGVIYQKRLSSDRTVEYDNVIGRVMVSFVY
jgi:hypothetical protein